MMRNVLRRLANQDRGTAVMEYDFLMEMIAVVVYAAALRYSAADAGYRDHPVPASVPR
jgi:Flp pilus assembly pilin Flp